VSSSVADSALKLSLDLWSAKVIVWTATVGRDVELTPDAHRFFFDRYSRLAEYHRRHAHLAKAARLQEKADEHYLAAGGDGPPYAAAMAMPTPGRLVNTRAVGRSAANDAPDDAA